MKTFCLLTLLVTFACIRSIAQCHNIAIREIVSSESLQEKNVKIVPAEPSSQTALHNTKAIKLLPGNGALLVAFNSPKTMYGHLSNKNEAPVVNWKRENLLVKRFAVTGLALIASRIPAFIRSLNLHQKGLSLRCQKTSYGSFNKARKKVTGITFSVPLGR